jgi:tRNA(Met) cytidine acetyltransferase
VTAPSAGAVNSVFRHAWREAFGTEPTESATRLTLEDGAELVFIEIRELLAQQPAAELVMVDEAAALPATLLKQVLLGWPRVAFASTVHGYEGSGRGFDIRFRAVLDAETPKWQSATLEQPIRWAASDPLERLASRLFLLDAEAPQRLIAESEPEVALWSPASAPEHELSEAFGLLVNAHYRTSPGDLRQWLDDPRAVSWVLRMGGRLAGVLWATREGGLDPSLAQDITLGKRRLRGHLLAQSLANHSGFPEAASLQLLRVVRVAVPADLRRQGLGRRLVAAATRWAADQGLDAVGTSFGGSRFLARFWKDCGLQFVRAGLQREASSGEYPVQYIKGLGESGQMLECRLAARLSEHWLTLTPLSWRGMEPGLLAELSASLPAPAGMTEDDRRDLHSFARGYRGYLLSLPVLRLLSLQPGVLAAIADAGFVDLWARAVLQGCDWPELQKAGLCKGRRDGEDRLRALVAGLGDLAVGL